MDIQAQMMSFHTLLPELAATETRVVTIGNGTPGFRPGEYIFLDLYCTDKGCDCRRAMIKVVTAEGDVFATLSYGWEDLQFYIDWMYGDLEIAKRIPGINIYDFQQQSEYTPQFLQLFRDMLADRDLAQRYQRHYDQFKAALASVGTTKPKSAATLEAQRKQRRRLNRLAKAVSTLKPQRLLPASPSKGKHDSAKA